MHTLCFPTGLFIDPLAVSIVDVVLTHEHGELRGCTEYFRSPILDTRLYGNTCEAEVFPRFGPVVLTSHL